MFAVKLLQWIDNGVNINRKYASVENGS
jgi:hypothetical protein